MNTITKDSFFWFLPKINIALAMLAFFLAGYLYTSLTRTYDAGNLASKARARPIELTDKLAAGAASALPLFQDDIFKKKPLFNLASSKTAQAKQVFTLVGVSAGKKNIAVLRDKQANKDFYLSEGEAVGEYKVQSIANDKVVLTSESGTLEISR